MDNTIRPLRRAATAGKDVPNLLQLMHDAEVSSQILVSLRAADEVVRGGGGGVAAVLWGAASALQGVEQGRVQGSAQGLACIGRPDEQVLQAARTSISARWLHEAMMGLRDSGI